MDDGTLIRKLPWFAPSQDKHEGYGSCINTRLYHD